MGSADWLRWRTMRSTRALGLFWLIVVATMMSVEVGAEEEAVSLGAATPSEDKYKPVYNKITNVGLTNINEWKSENEQLEKTNNKLRTRLSTPWKTKVAKDCCKYHEIPWFKFGFLGRTYKNKSKGECRALCNQYLGCRSYSYRFKDKTCIYSAAAVSYDSDWSFYSKKYSKPGGGHKGLFTKQKNFKKHYHEGKPRQTGTYHMFPGMKFLQPFKETKKMSKPQCEYACTKDLGCGSFSYDNTNNMCAISGGKVSYAPDFHYYEKDLSNLKKPGYEEKHEKENAAKEVLKENYVHEIDKTRRAEAAARKKEQAKKKVMEAKVKKDKAKKEKDDKKEARITRAEKKLAKTVSNGKKAVGRIDLQKKKLLSKTDKLIKKREKLQKKLLKVHHNEVKSKTKMKIRVISKALGQMKVTKIGVNMRERNQKLQIVKDKKTVQKLKDVDKEAKNKTAEAKKSEKESKKELSRLEFAVGYWTKKNKLATTERRKKKCKEEEKMAQEKVDKAKNKEERRIKEATRKETNVKYVQLKLRKKIQVEKRDKEVLKKKQIKEKAKKKAEEMREKRLIKERVAKKKEAGKKETVKKEQAIKEKSVKAKKEKAKKEAKKKEGVVKEKKKKIEMKAKAERKKKKKAERMTKEQNKKVQKSEEKGRGDA